VALTLEEGGGQGVVVGETGGEQVVGGVDGVGGETEMVELLEVERTV